jgi:glyoxylase-like metal-dependent hydrolase (beta-lactamase superfamily II)
MRVVPARNASPWTGPTGNNTFLLCGTIATLVDAGVGNPDHVDEIASALDGAALEMVLITHGHADHASGVPALVERWPAIRVLQYPGFGAGPIRAGDTELLPIHTPGHAPDHTCFFDVTSRDLYCGDLVRLGGTVVIPASRGGNLQDYLDSLARVRALEPRRLLPAHGPIIDDPLSVIDEYVRHRRMRQDQILGVLHARPSTVGEIAAALYPGLAPALTTAAADTVLAHLQHLEHTGEATRSGVTWRPR